MSYGEVYSLVLFIYIASIMQSNLLYGMLFSALVTGCSGIVPTPAPVDEPARAGNLPHNPPRGLVPAQPAQQASREQSEMLFQVLTSIGVDYKYGGSSYATGFDCSGLVAHVYHEGYGITLPRNTSGQSRVGQPVAEGDLRPGDLVFYNTLDRPFSHVGIYLGDGRFIHAPKTGAAVRIENLRSSYWSKRWNGARRISSAL